MKKIRELQILTQYRRITKPAVTKSDVFSHETKYPGELGSKEDVNRIPSTRVVMYNICSANDTVSS